MMGGMPNKYNVITRDIDLKIKKFMQMDKFQLAKHFNCEPEEVLIGDYIAKGCTEEECPYKVIVGFVNFEGSTVKEGKLETIIGRPFMDGTRYITNEDSHINYLALNTKYSAIFECKSIKNIYGNWTINDNANSLGSVQHIYGTLYLNNTKVKDTGKLKYIDFLSVDNSDLCELNVQHIGKLMCTSPSYITDFKNVKKVDDVMFSYFSLESNKHLYGMNSKKYLEIIRLKKEAKMNLATPTLLENENNVGDNIKKRIKPSKVRNLFESNFTYDGNCWINNNCIKQL